VVYNERREILKGQTLKEQVMESAEALADDIVDRYTDKDVPAEDWDLNGLREALYHQFNLRLDFKPDSEDGPSVERAAEMARAKIVAVYEDKEKRFGEPMLRQLEKIIMLQTIDTLWKDHLLNMDHLKEGIGLRGYGQKNPLQEYQKEGYDMFEDMIRRKEEDVVQKLFTVELARETVAPQLEVQSPRSQRMVLSHGDQPIAARPASTPKREGEKVGRNDPCPCGSGKKYKRCHGK
jgi:preprotein translocase subunit SecA